MPTCRPIPCKWNWVDEMSSIDVMPVDGSSEVCLFVWASEGLPSSEHIGDGCFTTLGVLYGRDRADPSIPEGGFIFYLLWTELNWTVTFKNEQNLKKLENFPLQKCQKIKHSKTLLHAILDFSYKMPQTKFGNQWSIWTARAANTSLNLDSNLASFPIENMKNTWKRRICGDSYLAAIVGS